MNYGSVVVPLFPSIADIAGKPASEREGARGRPFYERRWFPYAAFLVLLALLSLTSLYNYLLFHSLAEMFGVAASFTIAAVVLNSRGFIENNYLRVLGISYLFTAAIEILHMLAYQGMGVFSNGPDLPTQLWLALRYVQAISLVIAPLTIGRKLSIRTIIAGYAAVTSVLLSMIFLGLFPHAYEEGVGLTPFKIFSEYAIIALAALGGGLLYLKRSSFDRLIHILLMVAVLMFILAELMFTFYLSVYSAVNMLGHLFMLAEFFLVFMAIVRTGIAEPTRLLYRELAQREELFRGMVENARDILFQYKLFPKLELMYISPVVEEITGYPPEDYYRDPTKPFRREHRLKDWVPGMELNYPGDRVIRTYPITRRDGETVWLQVSMAIVRDEEGREVMAAGIARDVTESVRSVEQLRLAQHKLLLLGSLTDHDLRNHITTAAGYMGLATRTSDEGKRADFLNKGLKSLNDMGRLLDSTRNYYELGQVPPAWLDIRNVVKRALSFPELDHLDVRVELPDMEVYADELLVQVFHNLAQNTLNHAQGATEIRIHSVNADKGVTIIYEDNGPGVAVEDKEGIFEWNYRTRRGHGLHFVAEVLAATGMNIRETGVPGQGARFEIDVPHGTYRSKDGLTEG